MPASSTASSAAQPPQPAAPAPTSLLEALKERAELGDLLAAAEEEARAAGPGEDGYVQVVNSRIPSGKKASADVANLLRRGYGLPLDEGGDEGVRFSDLMLGCCSWLDMDPAENFTKGTMPRTAPKAKAWMTQQFHAICAKGACVRAWRGRVRGRASGPTPATQWPHPCHTPPS